MRTDMLAVWELAVQFDGCVCCRILTSSFHDWLDFMEQMMKGATVPPHHLVYHVHFTHTRLVSDYLSLSVSILSLPIS